MAKLTPEAALEVGSEPTNKLPIVFRGFQRLGELFLAWPLLWALLVWAAWMCMIFALSAQTGAETLSFPGASFVANLAHAPLFGLLALWSTLLIPRRAGWPRLDSRWVAGVALFVLAYAISDEYHQSFVEGRSASVLDILTDLVGALATLAVIAELAPGARRRGVLSRRILLGLMACGVAAALASL